MRHGPERLSWDTSDAEPEDLGPAEGRWDGQVATAIVMKRRERQGGERRNSE